MDPTKIFRLSLQSGLFKSLTHTTASASLHGFWQQYGVHFGVGLWRLPFLLKTNFNGMLRTYSQANQVIVAWLLYFHGERAIYANIR